MDYFKNTALLNAPVRRAAYSDRTSYVMAEMSRLAYFKFEGGDNLEELKKSIEKLVPKGADVEAIAQLIKARVQATTRDEGEEALRTILSTHGFDLFTTYNDVSTGTQGFLCLQKDQEMAILVFRGTEMNLKDIKSDVKATLIEPEGEPGLIVHEGYYSAFQSIRENIQADLDKNELRDFQMFITGHSLGGAIAMVATRLLASDKIGACYTFGSPPVGTADFAHTIRPPIYRIVNHIDIVPRMPNPFWVGTLIGLIKVFEFCLPVVGKKFSNSKAARAINKVLGNAMRYRQSGYSSFLVGNGKNARLRYTVGPWDLMWWWIKHLPKIFQGETKVLSDHSIDTYAKKLEVWAANRN